MPLDKDDLAYLKEVFVQKDDCSKTSAKQNEKITDLTVLLTKTNTKLSILIAILSAIAAPLLAICVKFLYNA